MLKYKSIIFCLLIWVKSSTAQTTFNQRFNWGSTTFAGNIWVEADGYVCSGIYNDTIGDTDAGLFIRKVDLEGNTVMEKFYSRDEWNILNYNDAGGRLSDGTNILATIVEFSDTIRCQLWWFNQNWDSLQTRTYLSPHIEPPLSDDIMYPQYLAVDSEDNIYVTCQISNVTSGDFVIMKLDNWGEPHWEYAVESLDTNEVCHSIFPTDSSVIVGYDVSTSIFLGEHFFELGTSLTNEPVVYWEIQNSSNNTGINHEFLVTDNTIVAASSHYQPGWNGLVPTIYSIDMSFNYLWETPATMAYYPQYRMQHVVQTADGGYLGAAREIDETITPSPEDGNVNENCLLAKYTGNGELLWTRRYHNVSSPEDQHTINDLKICADGGFIFCGEATNLAEDNNGNYLDSIPQQGWLVKVDSLGCLVPGCSVGILEPNQTANFLVYPNPASDFMNIYLETITNENGHFGLINLDGKEVLNFDTRSSHTTYMLDIGTLPNGYYVLHYTSQTGHTKSEKVMVMR